MAVTRFGRRSAATRSHAGPTGRHLGPPHDTFTAR
jgi:hypothetical protein